MFQIHRGQLRYHRPRHSDTLRQVSAIARNAVRDEHGTPSAISLEPVSAISGIRTEAMRGLLRDLGVPEAAMLVEVRSRDTRENARYSAALLRERGVDEVLLVTSALHMHRALKIFREEGLRVVPAATDHEAVPAAGWLRFVPDAAALEGSARAIKEWIGGWVG